MHKLFVLILVVSPFVLVAQQRAILSGTVTDAETGEPLIGATLLAEQMPAEEPGTKNPATTGTVTDLDGNYRLELSPGAYRLRVSYLNYSPSKDRVIELRAGADQTLDVDLREEALLLNTATVTSGRYERPLSEVTVSLEVIQPSLIRNSNQTAVDGVLEKIPGVSIVDGQPNIRGGSGYSYGAGSRVLLLVDDVPILQSDAGFPNWNDVPVENIEQIEVVKGAASALYGSSAMNGIINVRTGYAKAEPETSVFTFARLYDKPRVESAAWWTGTDTVPRELGFGFRHARKIDKLDLVLSGFYYNDLSYERSNYTRYGRGTAGLRYRFNDRLSVGVNANYNQGSNRSYFFWAGLDSLLYTGAPGTESIGMPRRYNIDPQLTYFARNGGRHRILSRYYNVENQNNANRSNSSNLFYGEYQYQQSITALDLVATGGLVGQTTAVQAELYGDTTYNSRNAAAYLQLEKRFGSRLLIALGARYEYNALLSPDLVNGVEIPGGKTEESKPVFRIGANYRAAEYTYLRASWGQGYRYPTVAEKFIRTDFGGVLISPNPTLRSETGWTAEVAVKQGFQIGGLQGFADVSAFWSRYQDMLEFSFTDFFRFGFQSLNVGDTDIKGMELSVGGRGQLFGGQTALTGGYTFIDPKFQEWDTNIPPTGQPRTQGQRNAELSTSTENVLKYRARHSAKLDLETTWSKRFSLGVAGIYNSRIENIDRIFQQLVVPELAAWRMQETGYFVLNLRTAYTFAERLRLSLLVDNALNEAYTQRPGLLEAPRSVSLRVDWDL